MRTEAVVIEGPAHFRSCNDDGDGGICTFCGRLHTVTVVRSCIQCLGPALPERDYCAEHPLCENPYATPRLVEQVGEDGMRVQGVGYLIRPGWRHPFVTNR